MADGIKLFDSHAHYDDKRFASDRHDVISSLPGAGVARVLNVGASMRSSVQSVHLAQKYDFFYCSVGVHPHNAEEVNDDTLAELARLSAEPKVQAIGEIGLDYYYGADRKQVQKIAFERQLILAGELDLPVIIHMRDATEDTLYYLKKYRPRGIVHCYSGSAETAEQLVAMGFYIGFTGVITFPNARKTLDAIRAVPLGRLLVETDCPYLSPQPYRGKRCDSTMMVHTAAKMAEVKGVSLAEMAQITYKNAMDVYGITG